MSKFSGLVDEVFAEEVTIDYTSLFGGEPYQIKSKEQVEKWEQQMKSLDTWQHATTYVIPNYARFSHEKQKSPTTRCTSRH